MRKNIKKIFLIGIIAILFMISGCTPPTFYYSKPENVEIQKIQLIEYKNPNVLEQEYSGFLFYRAKYEFENFDPNKCTVLEELKEEDFQAFNTCMEEDEVYSHLVSKRGHNGQGLRIIYSDESFFVLTWESIDSYYEGIVGYYEKNGTPKGDLEDIGPMLYMIIAANYFQTKIG